MTEVIALPNPRRDTALMNREHTNTIAELAVAMPEAIPVLERLGIDYCCQGHRTVQHACTVAGITSDELLQLIGNAAKPEETKSWDGETLQTLIAYIVDTHHVYTREALQRLQALAAKVRGVHGAHHPELLVVERLVVELASDLIPHMLKEEQVLFPFVDAIESAAMNDEEAPVPFFGTVRNPIRMMMAEHETAGEKLAEMRGLTLDYTLPEDACASFNALYAGLIELESDLHRHIHLENNILFPRAAELEDGVATNPLVGAISDHHDCNCKCGH